MCLRAVPLLCLKWVAGVIVDFPHRPAQQRRLSCAAAAMATPVDLVGDVWEVQFIVVIAPLHEEPQLLWGASGRDVTVAGEGLVKYGGRTSLKALQKDLSAERAALAELKKYDPQRLRKNLDASKKKLAEKTTAADKLQKSLTQARSENSQLELKIKELESQLDARVLAF